MHSRGCPRLHLVDPLSMCLAQRLLMYSSIDGAHYKEYAELQKKCASALCHQSDYLGAFVVSAMTGWATTATVLHSTQPQL